MENEIEPRETDTTEAMKLVEKRIERSNKINIGCIREAQSKGISYISFRFGGMLSGKTEGTIRDILLLNDIGFQCRVFKIEGDNRYVTDEEEVGSKSGIKIKAKRIKSLHEVTELITQGEIIKGAVIGLVELPFMCGNIEEYNEFENIVRRNGIIVIADGLGFWFNTQTLDIVERILETADQAFHMQAWNTFNSETLAEATLRCVRVILMNGKVVIVDKDALYYRSQSEDSLLEIIRIFTENDFYRDKITVHQAIIQTGYGRTVLLPSPPNDPLFAIGGPERYIPISINDMKLIYESLGFDINIFDPYELVYRYPNIVNWENENLVINPRFT